MPFTQVFSDGDEDVSDDERQAQPPVSGRRSYMACDQVTDVTGLCKPMHVAAINVDHLFCCCVVGVCVCVCIVVLMRFPLTVMSHQALSSYQGHGADDKFSSGVVCLLLCICCIISTPASPMLNSGATPSPWWRLMAYTALEVPLQSLTTVVSAGEKSGW